MIASAALASLALASLALNAPAQAQNTTTSANPNTYPNTAASSGPNVTTGVVAANVATASREVNSTGQTDHVGAGLRKPDGKLTFKAKIASGIQGLDAVFQKTVDLKDLLKHRSKASPAATAPTQDVSSQSASAESGSTEVRTARRHKPAPAARVAAKTSVPVQAPPVQPAPPVAVVAPPALAPQVVTAALRPQAPRPSNLPATIAIAVVIVGIIGAVIAAFLHEALAEATSHLIYRLRPPRIRTEWRAGDSHTGAAQFDDAAHLPAIGVIVRPGGMTTELSFIEAQGPQ